MPNSTIGTYTALRAATISDPSRPPGIDSDAADAYRGLAKTLTGGTA